MAGPLFNEVSTNTAAINTDVVVSLGAIAGLRRSVKAVHVSHSAVPAAGNATRLTVESPSGTVLYDLDILEAVRTVEFPNNGIPGASGAALVVRANVGAAAAAICTVNVFEGNG
jgi:hypothetical protein